VYASLTLCFLARNDDCVIDQPMEVVGTFGECLAVCSAHIAHRENRDCWVCAGSVLNIYQRNFGGILDAFLGGKRENSLRIVRCGNSCIYTELCSY
jgi:hypothetical protein